MVGGREVSLGVSHPWTGKERKEQNEKLVASLKMDIKVFKLTGEVLMVGDMNAHMEDLDGCTDWNRKLMLYMCEA